jgi:hypothetical protein
MVEVMGRPVRRSGSRAYLHAPSMHPMPSGAVSHAVERIDPSNFWNTRFVMMCQWSDCAYIDIWVRTPYRARSNTCSQLHIRAGCTLTTTQVPRLPTLARAAKDHGTAKRLSAVQARDELAVVEIAGRRVMILAVLSHHQGNYYQLVVTCSMVVRARDSSGITLEWALLNACAGVMGLLLLPGLRSKHRQTTSVT